MRAPGFVYVMVNPRAPQFVRVGKTTRPPEDTAQEENLQLRDAAYFADCMLAEGFCHDYLETFHTAEDPELFEVPVEIALKALSLAMERHVGTRAALPANPSLYDDEPVMGDGTSAVHLYEEGQKYRASGDPSNAIRYFKRAARLAEPRAFLALAEMTEVGEGCRADANHAVEWLNEGTRAGARECWGALADRLPQTRYLRPYFDGLEVRALTPEQKQIALRRMRLYLQLGVKAMDRDDARVIEPVVAEFQDRDLQRQWRRCAKGLPPGSSPALKWGLALAVAGGIGVLVPMGMQRLNRGVPAEAATVEEPAKEDSAKLPAEPAPKVKAKSKGTQPVQSARVQESASAEPAAPAHPVVHDGSPPETPKPVETQTWINKTPTATAEAASGREISSQELREHFNWSKEKASAAFKDSVVKITDTVSKVGKHDLSFNKIKCKFDGDPPARVEPGMTVTVEGTVHGKSWTGTITLDHCRVLP